MLAVMLDSSFLLSLGKLRWPRVSAAAAKRGPFLPLHLQQEAPLGPLQTKDDGPELLGTIGAFAFGLGLSEAVPGKRHG